MSADGQLQVHTLTNCVPHSHHLFLKRQCLRWKRQIAKLYDRDRGDSAIANGLQAVADFLGSSVHGRAVAVSR